MDDKQLNEMRKHAGLKPLSEPVFDLDDALYEGRGRDKKMPDADQKDVTIDPVLQALFDKYKLEPANASGTRVKPSMVFASDRNIQKDFEKNGYTFFSSSGKDYVIAKYAGKK